MGSFKPAYAILVLFTFSSNEVSVESAQNCADSSEPSLLAYTKHMGVGEDSDHVQSMLEMSRIYTLAEILSQIFVKKRWKIGDLIDKYIFY